MTVQSHNVEKSPPLHLFESGEIFLHQEHYIVRRLGWDDEIRQTEYQRLRTEMFVNQLQWDIPVDADGRERDHYDIEGLPQNGAYCVYGSVDGNQHDCLLCGLRLFQLYSWKDSMIPVEFCQTGMVPNEVIERLKNQYDCLQMIEMNRTCLLRGRRYVPPGVHTASFNLIAARDLAYACAVAIIEKTRRKWIMGIVHPGYLKALLHGHFLLDILYEKDIQNLQTGYALIVIDLAKSLRNMHRKGDVQQLQNLLTFCENKDWFNDEQEKFK